MATAKKSTAKKTATKSAAVKAPAKKVAAKSVEKKHATHEEIAELARKYWAERGHHDGHAEQDWLRAERELNG